MVMSRYVMKVATGEEFDVMRRYWQSAEGRAQLVPSYDEGTTIIRDPIVPWKGTVCGIACGGNGEGGGESSDARPAVQTVTLTVSFNFSYMLQMMSAVLLG